MKKLDKTTNPVEVGNEDVIPYTFSSVGYLFPISSRCPTLERLRNLGRVEVSHF